MKADQKKKVRASEAKVVSVRSNGDLSASQNTANTNADWSTVAQSIDHDHTSSMTTSNESIGEHEAIAAGDIDNENASTRTEPVSHVIELEPSYRTRYGAWCGIILLWLASATAVLLRGDAPEWLLLTTFSMVIIFSGVFPWLGACKLSYERDMSALMLEQGELLVSVRMKRSLPLPGIWYAIDDQLHNTSMMRDHRLKLRAGFMPLFHRSMSLTYRIQDMERGNYEAAPTIIRVGDWLGLTCIKVERIQKAQLIVLPRLEKPEEESYVARHTSSRWLKRQADSSYRPPSTSSLHPQQPITSKNEDELSAMTRPYMAGDSYRRIDQRAAARGRGLHTRMAEDKEAAPRLCIVLDQYDLPYRDAQQDQMFGSLISWCLADTVEAGERQRVSVLCDNWSFDYTDEQGAAELKYLLAITRPDVTAHMKDRVAHMSMLLPTGGHIVVYSGAWKDNEGWLALAEAALLKGSRLELQFVTTNRVMTYAMREQQKIMEQAGIQIVWRYSCEKPQPVIEIEKGSERYASGA